MTLEQLKELALHSVRHTAPENYSVGSVNEAIRDEFKSMCKNINTFMKNRYDIYEVIIETADQYVPNKVMDIFSRFANIQQVPQGQKAIFKRSMGRNRAKQFLTQVGLSGVYETFRLDNSTFTVNTIAMGGAVTIDFERMLDNAEILSECMDIILEAQVESIYGEVQRALQNAVNSITMPSANKVILNHWSATDMVNLMNTVGAYSNDGVVIFAPDGFVSSMGLDTIVSGSTNYQGIYHPDDVDAIHNTGYIRIFRGAPIVRIPQSYTDETNKTTVISNQFAYVFPAGKEKVVDIVLEGGTQMWDRANRDQSIEVNVYRKLGVGIQAYNNWGVYQNTTL